ncbi:aldo/keto reductase [candidate division KSB1 bacterium]|nr:aldo/keto reductase [candidate division KSB1 bacterium]
MKSTLLTGAALVFQPIFSKQTVLSHADLVPLGKTGLKISRLGLGAGSNSGEVQRSLGHAGFNKLIRYAHERGVRYIDTASSYHTHTWIREAIQGLPREDFFILTKMSGLPDNPMKELEQYRKELGVDYIDSLLVHAQVHPDWVETHKRLIDAFEEAKHKQIIRSHGVSCHSFPAIRKAAELEWVDVNLVRINPQGVKLDTEKETYFDHSTTDSVPIILGQIRQMKKNGHGVIGMKLIADGDFTNPQDRKKSIRFAIQKSDVDAVVIGFKSIAEIDEAIENINGALQDMG